MNTEVGKESPGVAGPPFDLGILRDGWQGIYITNGGYDQARGYTAVADGTADAVAFGTLFLANPDLVTRFRLDTPLNEPDPATFYGGGKQGYIDYPPLDDA